MSAPPTRTTRSPSFSSKASAATAGAARTATPHSEAKRRMEFTESLPGRRSRAEAKVGRFEGIVPGRGRDATRRPHWPSESGPAGQVAAGVVVSRDEAIHGYNGVNESQFVLHVRAGFRLRSSEDEFYAATVTRLGRLTGRDTAVHPQRLQEALSTRRTCTTARELPPHQHRFVRATTICHDIQEAYDLFRDDLGMSQGLSVLIRAPAIGNGCVQGFSSSASACRGASAVRPEPTGSGTRRPGEKYMVSHHISSCLSCSDAQCARCTVPSSSPPAPPLCESRRRPSGRASRPAA